MEPFPVKPKSKAEPTTKSQRHKDTGGFPFPGKPKSKAEPTQERETGNEKRETDNRFQGVTRRREAGYTEVSVCPADGHIM